MLSADLRKVAGATRGQRVTRAQPVVLVGAKDKGRPRRCRGVQTQVLQTFSMASVFGGQAIMLIRPEVLEVLI